MAVNDLSYTNINSTSLDLNDGTTYELVEIRGIYSPAFEPVFHDTPARRPSGVYVVHNELHRAIEIELVVNGSSLSALITNLKALWTHFYVDVREEASPALGTLTYTTFNSNQRAIACTPGKNDGKTDADQWWVSTRTATGKAIVTVRLDAPDPTFYDPSQNEETDTFNGTSNVTVSCTNSGESYAYPTILWGGVVTNGKVTDSYGDWCQMTDTVESGRTLTMVFNPQNKSFTLDTNAVWRDKREAGSQLVRIAPGTNDMTFVGEGAADAGSITVRWYDRYASIG